MSIDRASLRALCVVHLQLAMHTAFAWLHDYLHGCVTMNDDTTAMSMHGGEIDKGKSARLDRVTARKAKICFVSSECPSLQLVVERCESPVLAKGSNDQRLSNLVLEAGIAYLTSMIVLPLRLHSRTHLSSLKVTLQTASHGSASSLISLPVGRSQSLTLPSFPPVTMNCSLNCRQVTELSCAHSR